MKTETPKTESVPAVVQPPLVRQFRLGQEVMHKGIRRVIFDVDEGYEVLALDGDKYIAPNHTCNRCVEAHFRDCEIILPNASDQATASEKLS